jgi:hypothetical protein
VQCRKLIGVPGGLPAAEQAEGDLGLGHGTRLPHCPLVPPAPVGRAACLVPPRP